MKIQFAGQSDVGMKRPHNEDNFLTNEGQNIFIVADGMGGHSSGEVASRIAVDAVASFFEDTGRDKEQTWPFKEDRALNYDENRLVTAIKLANRDVYETAQSDQRYRGMGTTIVALAYGETGCYLGHVGDSRGYLVRGHSIRQVTEDHSLLNDYLKIHKLSADEIANFPHKNVIVRALGMKDSVAVDITKLDPQPLDIYILCSDGLSGMVRDDDILAAVVAANGDLEIASKNLIDKANANGGQDNVTVVLVQFSA